MRIIRGSHRLGTLPHGRSARAGNLLSQNQEVPAELLDEALAVDCPVLAGQASLHDGLAVHGSNPNRSDRRRCGMTIRFATPAVRLEKQAFWAPMLLRGEDRHHRLTLQPLPFPLPVSG
jgi:ectoine hydroxylase-related dioxygenase (phytanoyl-CoA dioxygenase family)